MIAATSHAQSPVDWTVHLRRAGPVRIGMTVAEARRALGDAEAFLSWGERQPDNAECAYLESTGLPKSLAVMFQNGRVARIDVNEAGIRTASGAAVDDTEEKIKRLYAGRIKVEPHHYAPDTGHYLKYVPADPADRGYGMVFETDGGKVTTFRTGTVEAVTLVEGCN